MELSIPAVFHTAEQLRYYLNRSKAIYLIKTDKLVLQSDKMVSKMDESNSKIAIMVMQFVITISSSDTLHLPLFKLFLEMGRMISKTVRKKQPILPIKPTITPKSLSAGPHAEKSSLKSLKNT